jgi:dephospho-CoA kinase
MNKIIGICGKRRSGKDTVANYICSQYNFENKKIADDLKSIIKILFGFSDVQLENNEKDIIDPLWNITPRQSMQFIGTEIMQYKLQELLPNIDRNFWIKSFINKNIINDNLPKKIVISDLRFLHEYKNLKSYNILIIRIEKDNNNNNLNIDEHISETEHIEIPADIIIKNNGSLEDLYDKLNKELIKFDYPLP